MEHTKKKTQQLQGIVVKLNLSQTQAEDLGLHPFLHQRNHNHGSFVRRESCLLVLPPDSATHGIMLKYLPRVSRGRGILVLAAWRNLDAACFYICTSSGPVAPVPQCQMTGPWQTCWITATHCVEIWFRHPSVFDQKPYAQFCQTVLLIYFLLLGLQHWAPQRQLCL